MKHFKREKIHVHKNSQITKFAKNPVLYHQLQIDWKFLHSFHCEAGVYNFPFIESVSNLAVQSRREIA